MRRTAHEIKESVSKLADLKMWAKQHPWMVAGSAVVIGLATGIALRPTREKNSREPQQDSEAHAQPGREGHAGATQGKSFLVSTLGTILTGILSILTQSLLSAAVNADDQVEPRSANGSAEVAESESGKD